MVFRAVKLNCYIKTLIMTIAIEKIMNCLICFTEMMSEPDVPCPGNDVLDFFTIFIQIM